MSAALALAGLAAAGGELRADGRRLSLLARAPLPADVRAAVRAAAPALLRVASDRWRAEMAAWPVAWRDLWGECAVCWRPCPEPRRCSSPAKCSPTTRPTRMTATSPCARP
jgi:hypothetical protein